MGTVAGCMRTYSAAETHLQKDYAMRRRQPSEPRSSCRSYLLGICGFALVVLFVRMAQGGPPIDAEIADIHRREEAAVREDARTLRGKAAGAGGRKAAVAEALAAVAAAREAIESAKPAAAGAAAVGGAGSGGWAAAAEAHPAQLDVERLVAAARAWEGAEAQHSEDVGAGSLGGSSAGAAGGEAGASGAALGKLPPAVAGTAFAKANPGRRCRCAAGTWWTGASSCVRCDWPAPGVFLEPPDVASRKECCSRARVRAHPLPPAEGGLCVVLQASAGHARRAFLRRVGAALVRAVGELGGHGAMVDWDGKELPQGPGCAGLPPLSRRVMLGDNVLRHVRDEGVASDMYFFNTEPLAALLWTADGSGLDVTGTRRRIWDTSALNIELLREARVEAVHAPLLLANDDGAAALRSALRCEVFAFGTRAKRGYLVTQAAPPLRAAFAAEAAFSPPPAFRVMAIMSGFNEGDVVESSIGDLLRQGCSVHFVDNWSTDHTLEIIRGMQATLGARFPAARGAPPVTLTFEQYPVIDSHTYDWAAILRHKTHVAARLPHDWIVHVDADELRESPWGPAVPLRQALYVAQVLGYNLVDFGNIVTFHPVAGESGHEGQRSVDLRTAFQHFEGATISADAKQLKAWRNYPAGSLDTNLVDLSSKGGHGVRFVSRTIEGNRCPWPFVLRHYPIRSQEHGLRKVFRERKGRWNKKEHGKGTRDWHIQYDAIRDKEHNFVRQKEGLRFAPKGVMEPKDYDAVLPCVKHKVVPRE